VIYPPDLGRPLPAPEIGASAATQRVYFRPDVDTWVGCWADAYGQELSGCQKLATTDILLCDEHYEEIVGGLSAGTK